MSAPARIKDSSEHLKLSAEHFRMSLPLLSNHGSDFGPQSYALWFTYVEGTNPALTAALDRFVKEGKRLTTEQTTQLYSSMLAGAEENAIASTHDAFLHLLTRTAASTSAASASATDFGETIQRESAVLGTSAHVDAERLTRLTEHSNLFARSLTLLRNLEIIT